MVKSLLQRLTKFAYPDVEFDADVGDTYFALRAWLAGLGISLPILLFVVGRLLGVCWDSMSSISAFHWLTGITRDLFTGILCAIGIASIIYRGYGCLENWLLNIAGGALVVVALRPMPWPPKTPPGFIADLNCPVPLAPAAGNGPFPELHYVAAVTFFVLIAISMFFCADDTLGGPMSPAAIARWRRMYRGFSAAMIITPFCAWLFADHVHVTLYLEAAGVFVFAAYWIVKTYELRHVSMVEPKDKPVARLSWRAGNLIRVDQA
jgi:hypothetical protein